MPPKKNSKAPKVSKNKGKASAVTKAPAVSSPGKDAVCELFKRFDVNGDGTIDQQELCLVLMALQPDVWMQSSVDRLFSGIDVNGDGAVSVEELLDWLFGEDASGLKTFKGALELADTSAGALTIDWAAGVASRGDVAAAPASVTLLEDLAHITNTDMAKEVECISCRELAKIAALPVVPQPIRRTLEAVCLLLLPSRGLPVDDLTPPSWPDIQHVLVDASFLQRVSNIRARKAEARKSLVLAGYIADVYFHAEASGPMDPIPLTYEQVLNASQIQFGLTDGKSCPVIVLYKWCLTLLEQELRELAAADVEGNT